MAALGAGGGELVGGAVVAALGAWGAFVPVTFLRRGLMSATTGNIPWSRYGRSW